MLDARNKLATLNLSGAVDMSDQSSSLRYIGLAAAHLTAIIQTVDNIRDQDLVYVCIELSKSQ